MCRDIVIVEYDSRRPGLPNAPVVMEYEDILTEQRYSPLTLNIQHNP